MADAASLLSTPAESEASMTCQLLLTTLAGTELSILNIAQYDRFEDLKDHIVDYLDTVTTLEVFGSEIDLVHPNTQEYLEDPIWDALQVNTRFNMIVRTCMETHQPKADFEEYQYLRHPKAVRVPATASGVIPTACLANLSPTANCKLPASVAH